MLLATRQALGDLTGARGAAQITMERATAVLGHDRSNGNAMAMGACALACLGQGDRAREWIGRAMVLDPENVSMRYNFACALSTYLADADGAVELLQDALENDPAAYNLRAARTDPDLDPIRENPRFKAIMAEAEARLRVAKPADGAEAPESA